MLMTQITHLKGIHHFYPMDGLDIDFINKNDTNIIFITKGKRPYKNPIV